MTLIYRHGDLWESGATHTVVTVNCVGAPGRGVALEWARRYPGDVAAYRAACRDGRMRPGRVMPLGSCLLMATKDHWRHLSQLAWVDAGLRRIAHWLRTHPDAVLALPRPGCGLGGLSWDTVGPLVREYLGDLDCTVMVYIGDGDEEY